MAGIDKRLTDLTEITNPSDDVLIHVVDPFDISQNPAGSSYFCKKSNFGGLSDAPSDGETYGRKDGAWEIVGGGDVLTTNTNITSSSLTTQDVAGFVAYINALNPIITLGNNDIRTYTVTDTGQKFELLLRGRSFGFSEPAILATDVHRMYPLVYKKNTNSASVTGTTAETVLETITVGANVFVPNDIMSIYYRVSKTGAAAGFTIRIKFNTSNTLAGAATIATTTLPNGTFKSQAVQRTINMRAGNIIEHMNNNESFAYENASPITVNILASFDYTNQFYIFITAQLVNGADSIVNSNYKIEKI